MGTFELYSNYYDLLYHEKNYEGEVEYVTGIIASNNPKAKTILDLGCGTGRHDFLLNEKGFDVDGVDISTDMIAIAEKKYGLINGLSFFKGDVTTWSHPNNKKYDVVISLFHVLSYQTQNVSALNMFITAFDSLKPGGLFIFDCWYGSAVLTERPETRLKTFENNNILVQRRSYPQMVTSKNTVDVNFEITITDKLSGRQKVLKELHSMRYFFIPELSSFASQAGFESIRFMKWLGIDPPTDENWYIVGAIVKPVN